MLVNGNETNLRCFYCGHVHDITGMKILSYGVVVIHIPCENCNKEVCHVFTARSHQRADK